MENKKRKWDLTKFCKNQEDFDEKIKQIEQQYPQLANFKGKLNDKKLLKEYLTLDDKMLDMVDRVAEWAHLHIMADVTDAAQRNNMQKVESLFARIGECQSYVMPELLSQSDQFFDDVIADDNFVAWRHSFRVLKKQKAHILTTEQEQLLSTLSPIMSNFSQIFQSCMYSDVQFGEILDENGNKHELTKTNYRNFLQNTDRVLRKNANERYYQKHEQYFNTLATNLVAQVQRNVIMSKIYKYNSVLEQTLVGNNMDVSFYQNFVKRTQPLFKLNKEYNNLKIELIKKQYNLNDLYEYDLGLPVGKKDDKISFEQGFEIVKKVLKVLGDEYLSVVQRAVDENWIDVYPDKFKQSGGFTSGMYKISPVILMNWENQLDDVYTFIHELGHAVRQVYCDNNNYREGAEAPMFIEETFSTVNQNLMYRYLVDNEKDKDKKIYYLCEYLDSLFSYGVGSIQDSMCEDEIYRRVAQEMPADKDTILNFANDVYKQTQADNILGRHIPGRTITMFHYYNLSYYVWQYSFGVINSNMIVNKIQQDPKFVEKYLNFVKAGSMYPLDMLKIVDIDYSNDTPFKEMEKELTLRINQLKELINK